MKEKIVLGADHAGYRMKEFIAGHLKAKGYLVEDVGCFSEDSVDYPAISQQVADAIRREPSARGVICCGSGIGVSIAANRFPWLRAVVAHDYHTAVMSRRHNDTNVICFGGRVIAPERAAELLDTWLDTAFEGGRHQKRVDMMSSSEGAPTSC